jgi:hypothetical protein
MERRWMDKGLSISPGEGAPAWLRFGLALFSLVLIAQAIWILLAELRHPRRIPIPVDQQASVVALAEQARAKQAARLAVIRGDLWADSAFTYSHLLWAGPGAGDATANEARIHLNRALRYSPHRGDVWLLLAAMADRYNWQDYKPSSLLKMSYYTAPNENDLFLLRIKVSLDSTGIRDPELADMLRRDIRLVINTMPAQRSALAAIYKAASGPSRQFVERVVLEVDPAYLAHLRTGAP